jgi:hypothetical protein
MDLKKLEDMERAINTHNSLATAFDESQMITDLRAGKVQHWA